MQKKTTLLAATLIAALCATAAQAATQTFKVNGQTISKAEQEQLISAMTARGQARSAQLENQVRYMLTRDAVVLQEAKKQKLENNSQVKKALEEAKNNILRQTLVNEYVKKHPVTDAEIKKLYDTEKERWGDTEVQVRHVLVQSENVARDLLARIKKGDDFAKIAKDYSLDSQANKDAGGLIEWNSPNVFDKTFAEAFSKLKVGEVSKNPVHTSLGWHVIKLEGKRPAQRWKDYKEVQPALRQALTQQRVMEYVNSLVQKAKITPVTPAAK